MFSTNFPQYWVQQTVEKIKYASSSATLREEFGSGFIFDNFIAETEVGVASRNGLINDIKRVGATNAAPFLLSLWPPRIR